MGDSSRFSVGILGFWCSLLVLIQTLQAHIGEYDDYLRERELMAKENLEKAYRANPEQIVNHYNEHAAKTMMGLNSTRRDMRGKKKNGGPCVASNPIDQCWRCDEYWEINRMKLADCALGFGHGTTGGKDGEFYVITDSSDDIHDPKPGTLRHAVIQTRPLWIIFQHSMVITPEQELLIMTNDKTIDGRGVKVHIAYGAGITIQFAKNIIIHNLRIHDTVACEGGTIKDGEGHAGVRTKSDGDGISIFGSTNVWIDHLSMYRCSDGLIDAIQGSSAITISNCHFTDHNDVMLFGAHDSYDLDEKMQITVALNHFGKGLVQRMPRSRFGFIHVVNNDYTHWLMYAIGGSSHPTYVSQGNRYSASSETVNKEVTKRDYSPESEWKNWNWITQGDQFDNGAFFVESGSSWVTKKYGGDVMLAYQPGKIAPLLTKDSGALNCIKGKAC
ncbi:putative pectate lyase 7 [Hibiscus syriacus]|uniref:Pectate lyase n=1 Tax=Hibiscus syriacus TaxID=106335 RepID=A0A6A3AS73_HIBSY|nr:pectate lyase-like [Hibiscus syriacus]KAE8706633.1 putative pectate lyase 7 [Hibiscus syriacus]